MRIFTNADCDISELYHDICHGHGWDITVKSRNNEDLRCFVAFSISSIPSTINKVDFLLYNHNNASGRTYRINRTTSVWNETGLCPTWDNPPSVSVINQVDFTTPVSGWWRIDVTNMFNDETGSTFGIRLKDTVEDQSTYTNQFRTKEYSVSDLRAYIEINGYYVKSGGNDSNLGTSWGNAWATINKAATTVPDGSTVHIGFGNYLSEPVSNKIAPQNAGTSGIEYLCETAGTGGGVGTVKVEKN